MQLRDYQQEALQALLTDSSRASLAVLATGLGKTLVACEVLRSTENGRSRFIVDSVDLLDQSAARIREYLGPGRRVGVFCGSREKDSSNQVTVATIQSALADESIYDYEHIDEVHMMDEDKGRYSELLARNPSSKIFGYTATPYRSNGYIYGTGKLFSRVTYERGILWGIENGWLVRPVLRGSSEAFDTSKLRVVAGDYDQKQLGALVRDSRKQITDALIKLKGRKKVIWFCSNIEHAIHVQSVIEAHGELASIIHSKQARDERAACKAVFEQGDYRHLVFVSTLVKGYDHPPIDALVILRPTRSATLWVQVAGRILRPYPGKTDALILDYGKVAQTVGPLDAPLVKVPSRRRAGETEPPMKQCNNCFQIVRAVEKQCSECGYEFPIKKSPLALRAEQEARLLSEKKDPYIRENIYAVTVYDHVSKSGRPCFRICYQVSLVKSYTEYMVREDWNLKNILKRFDMLGIKWGEKMPAYVKLLRPVKMTFEKMKFGVKYIGDEGVVDRAGDPQVGQSQGPAIEPSDVSF